MAIPDVQNFFHKAIAAHSKKKCCDQKCAVTVKCCTQRCYCELVTNVVDNNFQDTLYSPWERYSVLGNTRNTFNCSFRQLKQQTSGHNNSSFLGVCDLCRSPISMLQKKAIGEFYRVMPFSSCGFSVCGVTLALIFSHTNFHWIKM